MRAVCMVQGNNKVHAQPMCMSLLQSTRGKNLQSWSVKSWTSHEEYATTSQNMPVRNAQKCAFTNNDGMNLKKFKTHPVTGGGDMMNVLGDTLKTDQTRNRESIRFFIYLFNTVPLHSLKYNSQRLNRRSRGLVLVTTVHGRRSWSWS